MPKLPPLTFNTYAEVALAKWYEVEGLTPKTVASHRAMMKRYILPVIGEVPLYLVDNENTDLRLLLKELMRVKPYKTRRNRVGMLRRLLRTAQLDGFVDKIPSCVAKISIPNERKAITTTKSRSTFRRPSVGTFNRM